MEVGDKLRVMSDDRLVAIKWPCPGFNGHGQLVERGERRLSIFHMRNTFGVIHIILLEKLKYF